MMRYYVVSKYVRRLAAVSDSSAHTNDGRFLYCVPANYVNVFVDIAKIEQKTITEVNATTGLALMRYNLPLATKKR